MPSPQRRPPAMWRNLLPAILIALLAGGCGASSTATRFGGPLNHLHDMLALFGVPHTVLLASHIGLYRTADDGQTWTEVAGGAGQAMDGLMIYKLAQSHANPQRVYVLAIPRPDNPAAAKAPPGIYTSADAGQTWTLATAAASLPSPTIYTIGLDTTGGTLFAVLPALGQQGLYASSDQGAHWHAIPAPDPQPQGILGVAGQLYLWSTADGLFQSGDGGATWHPASGIQGGVFTVVIAGAALYASGDEGVFRAPAVGQPFAQMESADIFTSLAPNPPFPDHLFAVAGTNVEETVDDGKTWQALGTLQRHINLMTADVAQNGVAFAGASYPIGVERTTDGGKTWQIVLAGQ